MEEINGNKKQIVFVEHPVTVYSYKTARALKLSGKYETILITFSKIDKEFYSKAYDEIIDFELSHEINLKKFFKFFKRISSKEFKNFLKKIKSLNPYIFQITGPDLFTCMCMFILNKKPKVYFAYDIWAFNDKNIFFKKIQIKEFFQKKIERLCMQNAGGIIHKSAPESLDLLNYSVKSPDLPVALMCLDEFIIPPKKNKDKEIHIVYAGGPVAECPWRISFLKIIREITSQGIHFHTYGPCPDKKDERKFQEEAKKNKYFHPHKKINPEILKKEIAKFHYGIVPAFLNNRIDPRLASTSLAYKMFDYLEAGIPTILGLPADHPAKILEKNKLGVSIEYKDLKKLKEILEKKNYREMQKNVEKAQEKNRLSKKIKQFEKFYEFVVNRHKEY